MSLYPLGIWVLLNTYLRIPSCNLVKKTYSPTKHISQEETADYKSEYIDGQIIPLAGGTINHN